MAAFFEESLEGLAAMESAAQRKDAPALEAIAHRVRGGAAALGMKSLAAALRRTETAAGNGELEEAASALEAFAAGLRTREATASNPLSPGR